MPPARLPIPAPPAQNETIASYLHRLAALHGMPESQLWDQVSTPRPGTRRRWADPDRLAALVDRAPARLARALPELSGPDTDWARLRAAPQPDCPRCDARHQGWLAQHLLPHQRYVCTRHRYWIGPPDIGQAATRLPAGLDDIVRAGRRHHRLVRQYGTAAAFDAVLTGFLICGHLWADPTQAHTAAQASWAHRADVLIPTGTETVTFSASRIFAATYPEAVNLAAVIASPTWRQMATGTPTQQHRLLAEIARRVGTTSDSLDGSNAVTHWMLCDAPRPPSRPAVVYPDTHHYGAPHLNQPRTQSLDRHDRGAAWFGVNRRGGNVILHHRHIHAVLVREWSHPMDGIQATIWASGTTTWLPSPPPDTPTRPSSPPMRPADVWHANPEPGQKTI